MQVNELFEYKEMKSKHNASDGKMIWRAYWCSPYCNEFTRDVNKLSGRAWTSATCFWKIELITLK
jgi:hypothetical protein